SGALARKSSGLRARRASGRARPAAGREATYARGTQRVNYKADVAGGAAAGVLTPPSPHVGLTTLGSVVAAVAALAYRGRRPQPRSPLRRGRGCGRRPHPSLASDRKSLV